MASEMIFDKLMGYNVCFAVVKAYVSLRGVPDYKTDDCFIVADCSDKNLLYSLGFYYSARERLFLYDLSGPDMVGFRAISRKMKVVVDNEHGKVYERPDWSLREHKKRYSNVT